MIFIHYDFTDGTEVSYHEGLKLKNGFTTNCLDFFNFDSEADDVLIIDKHGNTLSMNSLLVKNPYTNKEIRTEHNIQKMFKANSFNWQFIVHISKL